MRASIYCNYKSNLKILPTNVNLKSNISFPHLSVKIEMTAKAANASQFSLRKVFYIRILVDKIFNCHFNRYEFWSVTFDNSYVQIRKFTLYPTYSNYKHCTVKTVSVRTYILPVVHMTVYQNKVLRRKRSKTPCDPNYFQRSFLD